jgi:hypothetical protein
MRIETVDVGRLSPLAQGFGDAQSPVSMHGARSVPC